jgi:hypothetical protein
MWKVGPTYAPSAPPNRCSGYYPLHGCSSSQQEPCRRGRIVFGTAMAWWELVEVKVHFEVGWENNKDAEKKANDGHAPSVLAVWLA